MNPTVIITVAIFALLLAPLIVWLGDTIADGIIVRHAMDELDGELDDILRRRA